MDGIYLLSLLTLLSNLALLFLVLLFVYSKTTGEKLWNQIEKKLLKYSILFSFIVTLTATLGSLYLSEVRGFAPCVLCWYQRVFMYPLPFILGTSLVKKTKEVFYYVLPLSTIGSLISSYHYYMQLSPDALVPCSTVGFSVSCSERFFTYFNYITIPWMALSAFVITILLMLIVKLNLKDRSSRV